MACATKSEGGYVLLRLGRVGEARQWKANVRIPHGGERVGTGKTVLEALTQAEEILNGDSTEKGPE